ncbi:MAG: nuclear transport factor 2 family protein [Bacteriovorax sp.]|nr:nuclear transport factor 2 family protein [Bacteriovorax sp.]
MANKSIEKELLSLEKQYWQAIKEKDADTAVRLSDDPCIIAGAQGVESIDRQKLGEMIQASTYTLSKFKIGDDAQVRFLSDDVAILAYTISEELIVQSQVVTFHASDTSTWIKREGSWLCAMHTESISGDPFGRNKN